MSKTTQAFLLGVILAAIATHLYNRQKRGA